MSNFLKAFITVSVLLNLLLVGVVIGNVGRYFIAPSKQLTVQAIAMALSADKREHLKDTIQRADQDIAGLRQQLSDARKKAAGFLKAEPFNKEAYLAQMQEIYQVKGKIRQRMSETVVGLAVQSNSAERTSMADILFQ